MSEEQKTAPTKDVELKDLNREMLEKQIAASEQLIQQYRQQIIQAESTIQQQFAVAGFARHLLEKYKIPSASKPEDKKPELEVK